MEKALAIQKEVMRILGTEEVYLVGGSVRDLVMGNTPKDYDFSTPLMPEVMEERIKAAGRKVYAIGKQFGTIGFKCPVPVKVINAETDEVTYETSPVHDGFEYVEVTTFRSEVYTSKSRKPEVAFVPNLDEDLARRDFTMNAMILRPDGSIYDPYGGKLDIYSKQIKTVGKPKDRIQEDPLRMLRAARFAARYNFRIDPNFIGKARQLSERIYDVSIERWVQELDKLITSEYTNTGLEALDAMGLTPLILPELPAIPVLDTKDPDEAWAILLTHLTHGKIENRKLNRYLKTGICSRLKFSNDRTKFILDN